MSYSVNLMAAGIRRKEMSFYGEKRAHHEQASGENQGFLFFIGNLEVEHSLVVLLRKK